MLGFRTSQAVRNEHLMEVHLLEQRHAGACRFVEVRMASAQRPGLDVALGGGLGVMVNLSQSADCGGGGAFGDLFRVHPATPGRLAPLLQAFAAADTQWEGQVSIITSDGIQMVSARGK